jgi:hypothetical protein
MTERRLQKLVELSEKDNYSLTSETGILLTGKVDKRTYEEAETEFLRNEWEFEECEDVEVSVQNRY